MGKEFMINISLKYASPDEARRVLGSVEGIEDIDESGDDTEITKITISCGPGYDPREDIYKMIKQQDWVIMEFHHEVQTLEKVFRDITRGN
jgi:hypothetical protein